MGMTIDEIIQGIQVIKAQAEWDYPLDWQIVFDGAIDTMRKYQQIVNIVSLNDEEFKQCGLKELKEILEVIADGAINSSDCIRP